MAIVSRVLTAPRSLALAIAAGFRVLFASGSLRVVSEDPKLLVLRYASLYIVVNRAAHSVKAGRSPLKSFDQFTQIEVIRHFLDEGNSERWSIFLRERSEERLWLGSCGEPTEASVIGAKLSAAMSKPIKAFHE